MKSLIYLGVLSLLLACLAENKNGKWERIEYHPNGKVKSKIEFVDSVREGKAVYYYSNGAIKSIGDWHKNKLHGQISFFDSSNNRIAIESYKNGMRNGVAVDFFPSNGNIRTKLYYKDDILHGKKQQYFENDSGKIFAEIYHLNFQDRQKEYGSAWYDSKGNLVREFRRVVVKATNDTIKHLEALVLEIELRKPRFDSTTFIVANYEDKFYKVDSTSFDTLKSNSHKVKLVKKGVKKGDNFIRGFTKNWKVVNTTEEETITEETLPIYFEYHYFVK